MTNQELLISHISKLSEDEISSLLDAVTIMIQDKEPVPKPACPHCAAKTADTLLLLLQISSWQTPTSQFLSGKR